MKNYSIYFCLCLAVVSGLISLCSCSRNDTAWRSYTQIDRAPKEMVKSPVMGMQAVQQADNGAEALQWTAPQGWNETKSTGMRRATFTMDDGGLTGICTIVVLSGMAGGLEANVVRWLGQLGQEPPPDDVFEAFLKRQLRFETVGGFQAVAVDLSELAQPGDEQASSMMGAVIPIGGGMCFVKLTGTVDALKSQKESFLQLCRSLQNKK